MTTHLERYQHEIISMGFRAGNPYEHPNALAMVRSPLNAVGETPVDIQATLIQARSASLNYFGWELMHGADVEELKRDPYWFYMEGDGNDNTTTATTDRAA